MPTSFETKIEQLEKARSASLLTYCLSRVFAGGADSPAFAVAIAGTYLSRHNVLESLSTYRDKIPGDTYGLLVQAAYSITYPIRETTDGT